jgi:hypothetical protein
MVETGQPWVVDLLGINTINTTAKGLQNAVLAGLGQNWSLVILPRVGTLHVILTDVCMYVCMGSVRVLLLL